VIDELIRMDDFGKILTGGTKLPGKNACANYNFSTKNSS
jgi:hypothetical protein